MKTPTALAATLSVLASCARPAPHPATTKPPALASAVAVAPPAVDAGAVLPEPPKPTWKPHQRVVYRLRDDTFDTPEVTEAAVVVQVDDEGRARIRVHDTLSGLRYTTSAEEIGAALFPAPVPVSHARHRVDRLDHGDVEQPPRADVERSVTTTPRSDGLVEVRAEGDVAEVDAHGTYHTEEHLSALYDVARGRYSAIRWVASGRLASQRPTKLSLDVDESFDDGRDLFPRGPSQAEWERTTTPDQELAKALAFEASKMPFDQATSALRHQIRARPVEAWKTIAGALAKTGDLALAHASDLLCEQAPDLDAATLRRLAGSPIGLDMDYAFAGCPDEHVAVFFRRPVRLPRFETTVGRYRAMVAWRAKLSLELIGARQDLAGAFRANRPSHDTLEILTSHALLTRAFPPEARRSLVPVLVDWLRANPLDADALALLHTITARHLGSAGAWAEFAAAHANVAYTDWIVEAARSAPDLRDRMAAYELLGRLPRTAQSEAALVEGLRDAVWPVRVAAACALAFWRDRRGAAIVVDALDELPALRTMARDALAMLHPSSLGYDADAQPAERAQAIARWREWLARP
jgi:hypothetical protein